MIHHAFHNQALLTPHHPCLIDATTGRTWSYRETQHRVLSLALELRNAGTCEDRVVAIYMEPCPRFVVSMLAALSAGGAYVPLELAYPTPMVQRVLDDAKPTAICTTLQHVRKLPAAAGDMAIVCEDDGAHEHPVENRGSDGGGVYRNPGRKRSGSSAVRGGGGGGIEEAEEKEWKDLWELYQRGWCDQDQDPSTVRRTTLDDLAFVVYSSGTTGQPKGIAIPHRAPAVSYAWRFETLSDYKAGDVVACNVFFVWEAVRAIMRGGTVIPVPADDIFDGERLTRLIEKFRVTEILFTPSLLDNLLLTVDGADVKRRMKGVKTVYLNGEVVSLALRKKVIDALEHVRLLNLYSISECHEVAALDLTNCDLKYSDKFCPVGYPAVDECYILDEDYKPTPNGEAGELFVGGDMLAREYLNLPDLTSTRFLPDPFADEKKKAGGRTPMMYRTGDRARMLANGQLEILGRCDFMVKIRGYSVVLGAVESALVEHVKLASCVVVADGEEGSEDKQLIAYLVRDHSQKEDDTRLGDWTIDTRNGSCPEIRRAIDGHIAHYMVPSVYIEVESLPVSAVGAKLDRKALAAQTADRRTMMRSLQLNFETHTTASTSTMAPAVHQPPVTMRKLAKYLRVPRDSPLTDVESAMEAVWESILVSGDVAAEVKLNSDFLELGGHSLSAARLVAGVNKCFGVSLSAARLFRENYSVQGCCAEVLKQWSAAAEETVDVSPVSEVKTVVSKGSSDSKDWSVVEDDEQGSNIITGVRSDAVLPPDITFQSTTQVITVKTAQSIFLTGATGYLGVNVLCQILATNDLATVTCLVRSDDPDAIKNNGKKYGLQLDHYRIILERGDLSLPHFGMSQGDWNRLSASIDTIVHCGALVSLTAPYEGKMRDANVGGTLETIKLASACKAGTSLVYVSSNGIFPSTSDEIFLENDVVTCLPDRLGPHNGYGLSKWAAEQLVGEANKIGLPTLALRFGNIGWSSKTAIGNALDYQAMMLGGCINIGKTLTLPGWKFECTPIDFASKALIALASDVDTLKKGSVLNCVQDGFTPSSDVFACLNSVSGRHYPSVNFATWSKLLEDATTGAHDDSVMALYAFIAGLEDGESYLTKIPTLDCSVFDATLQRIDPSLMRQGAVNKFYFENYFRSVLPSSVEKDVEVTDGAVSFDPTGTCPVSGPLAGQIAVVTGASSGIGRAVVSALVKAGCHVAMGARRVEELEKTRELIMQECPGTSSKALIVKTDVTKLDDVKALVQKAEESLGTVDILVNVAGVMYFTLMKNCNEFWPDLERTVDVNCKGTMYGIGSVLPNMLSRGKGHIVNITSDAGRKAFPGLGVYSGSKFFVEAMSQALRAETASTGLRVTCIQPGNVETPLLATSTDAEGLKEYGEPTGAKVLEPRDIGRAVVYALSQPEWCAVNEILIEPREEPA
ncbi:predicted protein [Thalassiosira pseudonana CCMP1335]|uniref:Carrier domain-containing protein n=1 Tax=Thalassiosira pseudonana TaxID=35128 RepID=B8C0S0_THAPS|nr:predicted protein [Thalassiosira pseudonana CCMP1335]EED93564.1 predicted protein [Thalassiosira pseudonana CCMP1335]